MKGGIAGRARVEGKGNQCDCMHMLRHHMEAYCSHRSLLVTQKPIVHLFHALLLVLEPPHRIGHHDIFCYQHSSCCHSWSHDKSL